MHLRHGTYRKLPLSKPSGYNQQNGTYRPVRSGSFELGNVDDGELPAWSDDEEDENNTRKKHQHKTEGAATTTPNVESSLSAGNSISRPQSRAQVAGRRGSNIPPQNTSQSSATET